MSPVAKLSAAWHKLRWSLAHRGPSGTIRFALQRVRRLPGSPEAPAGPHPFDLRHGVDTGGLIGGGDLRSGHQHDIFNTAYYGMAPSRFVWMLEYWIADSTHPPINNYSFVDLGCGKGRALMLASELPFRGVIGVELHPGLAGIASHNLALWNASNRGRCPTHVVCQDATDYDLPEGPCLLYLFNPFGRPVVQRLINRLAEQFSTRPGLLDIIYFNPESGDLFDDHPGFQRLWMGTAPMSEEDAAADTVASPDDLCSVYRWLGADAATAADNSPNPRQ